MYSGLLTKELPTLVLGNSVLTLSRGDISLLAGVHSGNAVRVQLPGQEAVADKREGISSSSSS